MCGIAGVFDLKGNLSPEEMERMLDAISHRGPDDRGMVCLQIRKDTYNSQSHLPLDKVGLPLILGHCRLSVIDPSPAGHQPMPSSDGRLWITYNGEVFNYKELREELRKKGYTFNSMTDTEVVLYAYKEYGESCLKLLRGFFAFCIYDAEKRLLFMARDRLGLKPLKYYWDGQRFAFASEVKALLQLSWVSRMIDPVAIDQYLTYRYIPVPRTGIMNIHKLPAGCSMTFFLDNPSNGLCINRYWLSRFEPKRRISFKEAIEYTGELLEESTYIRLMADCPLGVFLSGGLDSSSIVAMLRRRFNGEIRTFSAGFVDEQFDERPFARMVARRFSTTHNELVVEIKPGEDIHKIIWHLDEPFGDPSAIPAYYLAKAASGYVKVILGGDGGDELFGGYKRYHIHRRNYFLDYLPKYIHTMAGRLSRMLPLSVDKRHGWGRVERLLESISGGFIETYPLRFSGLSPRIRRNLYRKDYPLKAVEGGWDDEILSLLKETGAVHPKERLIALDLLTYLPEDILVKSDLTGMAHGLEVRLPFLDHLFVEWVNLLPLSYKINRQSKWVLRKMLTNELPQEILRRKKAGFNPPLRRWMKGVFKDELRYYLLSDHTPLKFLKTSFVEQMFTTHQLGRSNLSEQLWLLLVLAIWLERNNIDI